MKAISKLGAERIPRPPGNCIQILASNINAILGSGPKGLSNRGDHTARQTNREREEERFIFSSSESDIFPRSHSRSWIETVWTAIAKTNTEDVRARALMGREVLFCEAHLGLMGDWGEGGLELITMAVSQPAGQRRRITLQTLLTPWTCKTTALALPSFSGAWLRRPSCGYKTTAVAFSHPQFSIFKCSARTSHIYSSTLFILFIFSFVLFYLICLKCIFYNSAQFQLSILIEYNSY